MYKVAITARMRNGALWQAAEKMGGIKPLAEHLGVRYEALVNWLNFRTYPNWQYPKSKYNWPDIEGKLFALTGLLLEDIFPPELATAEFLDRPKVHALVQDVPVLSLTGMKESLALPPMLDESIARGERDKTIDKVLADALTPREADVIKRRFGLAGEEEQTIEAIGQHLGITRERARQIESKALRLLRHPKYSRALKPFFYD